MFPIDYISNFVFLLFIVYCADRSPAFGSIAKRLIWMLALSWGTFIEALWLAQIIPNVIAYFK